MSVRIAPLPEAPARGRLIVPSGVISRTEQMLRESAGADGPHEGVVLWGGRVAENDRIVAAPVAVAATTGWGHVHVDAATVGHAGRVLRRHGLTLVAQVHSHPGDDTRHSDGDDTMIIMAHQGMWSLVARRHGRSPMTLAQIGIHQRQDGRWVAVQDAETSFIVIPDVIKVRS